VTNTGAVPAGGGLKEEWRKLLALAQNGDKTAKDELVCRNLPLVRAIASRFNRCSIESEDLMQIGIIGLLKAIERFDLTMSNTFSTYAVPLIIGEMRRALRDDSMLRVSRSRKELASRARFFREDYIKEHGEEPSVRETAKELNVSVDDLTLALEATGKPLSLSMPVGDEDDHTLLEYLPSDDNNLWRGLEIKDSLSRLPARLRYILEERYFAERTQEQIAAALGVSQAQISRLEKQALAMLYNIMKG